MSIQQLQADLAEVIKALPTGPLVSGPDLADYLKHNLLPLLESHVNETAEIDEAVENLVKHEADILHEETAAVFASVIVSGRELAKELAARMGNDQRLHRLVKEYREIAADAEEILNDITVPDDDEEEAPEPEATPATVEAPTLPEGAK